jgi:hypothetical protein
MPYRLLFCAEALDPSATLSACPEVLEFRRDVIASDPDWTRMRLLPRPDDADAGRYLVLEFDQVPPADQVRDLRYVAARNRLVMTVQAD